MNRMCQSCGKVFFPRHHYYYLCLTCWKEENVQHAGVEDDFQSEFKEMLPKLIMLAHPDRHGGSRLAVTVTQWLLEQRKLAS